jgi:hypothetical protein
VGFMSFLHSSKSHPAHKPLCVKPPIPQLGPGVIIEIDEQ